MLKQFGVPQPFKLSTDYSFPEDLDYSGILYEKMIHETGLASNPTILSGKFSTIFDDESIKRILEELGTEGKAIITELVFLRHDLITAGRATGINPVFIQEYYLAFWKFFREAVAGNKKPEQIIDAIKELNKAHEEGEVASI
ncbi:MAG: hypothetical protein JNK26_00125 [Candidatus Doudnabacteria bacterium]|nr:hypothetical protein [Candidatus Doudnabacteria bacterium]